MNTEKIKILHLEDRATDVDQVHRVLKKGMIDFEARVVDTRDEFTRLLKEFNPDVVISDHSMPSFNSLEALEIIKGSENRIPFILVTGTVSEEFAALIIKSGADDYILKDRLQRLPSAVINALEKNRLDKELQNFLLEKEHLASKAAEELHNEREKLKAIIENMNAGLVVADRQGRFIFSNDLGKDLFGIDPAEGHIENWSNQFGVFRADKTTVFPSDELPMTKAINGLRTDKEILFVKNEVHPEGVFLSVSGAPIFDKDGQAIYSVTLFRDVTESVIAGEKLKESFEALRSATEMQSYILDTLPANIALLDKDGVIVDVNKAWKQFGIENSLCSPNYNINDNYIKIARESAGDDREVGYLMAEGIIKVINGELPGFSMEYPCHSPTEKRWFKAEVAPLMKEHGKGAVVMHINITERKIAELALQDMNESLESKVKERTAQLEEVNQELEAFSYSASHDLRAPLRAVNGFSKILEEDYGKVLDDEGNRLLKIIQRSAQQMNTQIDDLLAFSKLGRQALRQTTLNMTELMHITFGEISQMINHNAVVKINDLHPVQADPVLMKHVLMNLLSNAIKYSSQAAQPRIEVSSDTNQGEVVYSVKDNGVGFDMKYVDKIFGVFQRLHTNDQFEGTGVGLAIVQRIIHRHKGKVWAEGKVGKGATFYFSLPIESTD